MVYQENLRCHQSRLRVELVADADTDADADAEIWVLLYERIAH